MTVSLIILLAATAVLVLPMLFGWALLATVERLDAKPVDEKSKGPLV